MITPQKSANNALVASDCQARNKLINLLELIVANAFGTSTDAPVDFTGCSYFSPSVPKRFNTKYYYYLSGTNNLSPGGNPYNALNNTITSLGFEHLLISKTGTETPPPLAGDVIAVAWYSQKNTLLGFKYSWIQKVKLFGILNGVISVHDEALPVADVLTLNTPSSYSVLSLAAGASQELILNIPTEGRRTYNIFWPGRTDLSAITFPFQISASGYDQSIHFRTPIAPQLPWSV